MGPVLTGASVAVTEYVRRQDRYSLHGCMTPDLIDDDVPRQPDPWVDDLASAQARRAIQLELDGLASMNEQPRLPVVIHP